MPLFFIFNRMLHNLLHHCLCEFAALHFAPKLLALITSFSLRVDFYPL